MKRSVSILLNALSRDWNTDKVPKVESDEAPSGMLARGHYEAVSKFQDDDGHEYLKFEWSFDIGKDWKV